VDGLDDRHRINAILDINGVHLGTDQQPAVSITIWRLRCPLIFLAAFPGSRLCRQGCGTKLIEAVGARERGCVKL
jgi:hypothetical protein